MATTHRSDLIEALENAFTDEAYDGGMGALSPEQFAQLVRTLASTAFAVLTGAHDCEACVDCLHGGRKCCGCYDGACCRESEDSPLQSRRGPTSSTCRPFTVWEGKRGGASIGRSYRTRLRAIVAAWWASIYRGDDVWIEHTLPPIEVAQ